MTAHRFRLAEVPDHTCQEGSFAHQSRDVLRRRCLEECLVGCLQGPVNVSPPSVSGKHSAVEAVPADTPEWRHGEVSGASRRRRLGPNGRRVLCRTRREEEEWDVRGI